jgi:methyl-accepting chemotaxis protein
MKLNDLRIATRLWLGFGIVLVLLALIVGIGYTRLTRSQQELAQLAALRQRADLATEWAGKTELNVSRLVAIAKASGQPDIESYFAPLIKQTSAEISVIQKQLDARVTTSEGRALMAEIASKRDAYVAVRWRLLALLRQADAPAADTLLKDGLLPAAQTYLETMGRFRSYEQRLADDDGARADTALANARTSMVALLLVSLAAGAGLALAITRSVTTPLQEALRTARVIADCDLSHPVDSARKDELGELLRALGRMQNTLRGLVGQVRRATDSISTASVEIASGNLDLSARTEQAAANLEQTAASMEELTGTVKQSADAARQATQLASSAAEVASRGGKVVSEVVATMDQITASSKQIADITGVIDGIAFQTNILALNAAVEAARAGEQGRGFAVVASEVRSLAQRSAEAAKEIKGLIGASVERVEGGSRLAADAGKTMAEIVGSVQRVCDIIGEVSAASIEQSHGIAEINGAVSQLDQMTQQNAALVEESAAAAESLKAQAQQLVAAVAVFTLDADPPRATPTLRASVAAARPASKPAMKPAATAGNTPAPRSVNCTSAPWDGVERRGPDRPRNVVRLAPPATAATTRSAAPVVMARLGTGTGTDDWESF